jgi:hypothetical protein
MSFTRGSQEFKRVLLILLHGCSKECYESISVAQAGSGLVYLAQEVAGTQTRTHTSRHTDIHALTHTLAQTPTLPIHTYTHTHTLTDPRCDLILVL